MQYALIGGLTDWQNRRIQIKDRWPDLPSTGGGGGLGLLGTTGFLYVALVN